MFELTFLMLFSELAVTMIEHDTAIGFVYTAATIGNVRSGFGEIGPMGSLANVHAVSKVLFIVDMPFGRLDLIPFLVILSPEFLLISKQ